MKTHKILTTVFPIPALLAAVCLMQADANAQFSLDTSSGTYTQNFDSLINTGTNQAWSNNTTLPGWYLLNTLGNAISTYNAGTGSSNTGNFYSFGATADTERALGGVGSGGAYFGSPSTNTAAGYIALAITNNTGGDLSSFVLGFSGEQWRDGGSTTPAAQSMVLEYGFGATFGAVGSWVAPGGGFNWSSPVFTNTSTGAAVDGNTAGRVNGLGGTISDISWATGDTLWLRWIEKNDVGNDHGLAIDDLSFQWNGVPLVLNYWDPVAGGSVGGTGTWTSTSLTWNPQADGSGAPQALSAATRAVFTGGGGTVTIGTGAASTGNIWFESGGYTLSGGSLTLGGTKQRIEVVNAADTATISASLGGTEGLNKTGAGTLVLSGANTYTGTTKISGGTLQINANAALGDAANGLDMSSGRLKTTGNVVMNRKLTGTGGTLDLPAGSLLTVSGEATTGLLTLANAGGLLLSGSAQAIGGLSFMQAATVTSSGAELGLNGNISTTHTAGTAQIVADSINFGTGDRTVNVVRGSASVDLRMSAGFATGTNRIIKAGDGVLELAGDFTGVAGLTIGSAGTAPALGGTIATSDSTAFGAASGTVRFNGGAIRNTNPTQLIVANNFSVGAGQLGDGAVFEGSSPIYVGSVFLFKGGVTGTTYQHKITVKTDLHIQGGLNDVPVGESAGAGTSTGLTFTGGGRVYLDNQLEGQNNFILPIVMDGAELVATGGLSAAVKPTITAINAGRVSGSIAPATPPNALGPVTIGAGGILSPGNPTDTTGMLNTQNLTFLPSSTFEIHLGGLTSDLYDYVNIAGTVSLNGSLNIIRSAGYTPALDDSWMILVNDGTDPVDLTGTFADLPEGTVFVSNGFSYRLDYYSGDGNDVTLIAVPEPASMGLLALGALGLGSIRRRRKA